MADITICTNYACKVRRYCGRYTAVWTCGWQAFQKFSAHTAENPCEFRFKGHALKKGALKVLDERCKELYK